MLKTISSSNSLIVWKRNSNDSNIALQSVGGDELFFKKFYASLFSNVAEHLKTGIDVFTAMWSKECDIACKNVYTAVYHATHAEHNAIEKIVNKFRGNAGEIMIEALVDEGIINIGKPGTYVPVDPAHERYVDATMEKDGLPIGIQIKNYSIDKNVMREVFTKAAAMSDIWLRHDKKISDDMVLDFIKTPCQYVIATCKPKTDILLDEYKNCVVFFGPDWLDSLKLQGCKKTGEASRWKIFKNIADEISNYAI